MKTFFKISAVVGMASLLIAGGVLFNMAHQLPANVVFEGVSLGGMKKVQAEGIIDSELDKLRNVQFVLTTDDHTEKVFTPSELGIRYRTAATLQNISDETSIFKRLMSSQVNAMDETQDTFKPVIEINEEKLKNTIKIYLTSQEKEVIEPYVMWGAGEYEVTKEESGRKLKPGELGRVTVAMMQAAYPLSANRQFVAAYDEVRPTQKQQDLIELKDRANTITKEPIEVVQPYGTTVLDLSNYRYWLTIDTAEKTVEVYPTALKKWIKEYAQENKMEPGKVTVVGVEEVRSEYDGRTVKRAKVEGTFEKGFIVDEMKLYEAMRNTIENPEEPRRVIVAVQYLEPKILSQVPGLNFPDKLSTGKSSYQEGNKPNRVTNVKLSLDQFDTLIIEPGEIFSFNRATGWITEPKGYVEALILAGAVAVPGIGGGVCQTSTTMYRAALNAGLPVIERRPHSADVSYYHEYGHGLDATVYPPNGKDVRFVNDTGNAILIHTYTTEQERAYVEMYGTSDGRIVEFEELNTGYYLTKKWNQFVTKGDITEKRVINTRYFK